MADGEMGGGDAAPSPSLLSLSLSLSSLARGTIRVGDRGTEPPRCRHRLSTPPSVGITTRCSGEMGGGVVDRPPSCPPPPPPWRLGRRSNSTKSFGFMCNTSSNTSSKSNPRSNAHSWHSTNACSCALIPSRRSNVELVVLVPDKSLVRCCCCCCWRCWDLDLRG